MNLNLFKTILHGQGFEILEAHNCAEALALQAIHHGSIDLVVADLTLPDDLGTKAAVQLRSLQPELRFLFVSGTPMPYWPEDATRDLAELPLGDWLPKPFLPKAFLEKVRGVMHVHS